MSKAAELTLRMAEFNSMYPALTQHFVKVHGFASAIGRLEGLDAWTQETLELAAIAHDIGIKLCIEKYGKCTGKMQEEEGPSAARPMLASLGIEYAMIDRICHLIGHHHTYTSIDGLDYQILVEADFLVNLHEGNQDDDAKRAAYEKIFKTTTGKQLFSAMFGTDNGL